MEKRESDNFIENITNEKECEADGKIVEIDGIKDITNIENPKLMQCPVCKKMISRRAETCVLCGAFIQKEQENVLTCSDCGAALTKEDKICPNCGCPVEAQNNNDVFFPKDSKSNSKEKNNSNIPKRKISPKMIGIIIASVVVLCLIVLGSVAVKKLIPDRYYKKGETLFSEDKYEDAAAAYEKCGNYLDAVSKREVALEKARIENLYKEGIEAKENNDYHRAITLLEQIQDYKDAKALITDSYYLQGENYYKNGDYDNALASFDHIENIELTSDLRYKCAIEFVNEGDYAKARETFDVIGVDKNDSYYSYLEGIKNFELKQYKSAADYFDDSRDVLDGDDMYYKSTYMAGTQAFNNRDYDEAKKLFQSIKDYEDSSNLITACDLKKAEESYNNGDLNKSLNLYKSLPEEYSYGGISVAQRLEVLNKYEQYVNLCGQWKATEDDDKSVETAQIYRRTGSSESWSGSMRGTYTMDVRCVINSDGTVTIKGKVEFVRFTSYSSISAYCDYTIDTVSFNEKISTIPSSLNIGNNCKISYSEKNGFTLNYDYTDETYSQAFKYRYRSTFVYRNRGQVY